MPGRTRGTISPPYAARWGRGPPPCPPAVAPDPPGAAWAAGCGSSIPPAHPTTTSPTTSSMGLQNACVLRGGGFGKVPRRVRRGVGWPGAAALGRPRGVPAPGWGRGAAIADPDLTPPSPTTPVGLLGGTKATTVNLCAARLEILDRHTQADDSSIGSSGVRPRERRVDTRSPTLLWDPGGDSWRAPPRGPRGRHAQARANGAPEHPLL